MSTIQPINANTADLRQVRWSGMVHAMETSPLQTHITRLEIAAPCSIERGHLFGGNYKGRARFT